MAYITKFPKPGAHCKNFKPKTYGVHNRERCELSDTCKWKEQGYKDSSFDRTKSGCSGIKENIIEIGYELKE